MGSDFYIIDNDDFSFAIISNEPTFVCNIAMRKTSNSRVFVVDDVKTIPLARLMTRDTNAPIDLDLIMDLKLFYIEENTRNRTTELYRTIYNEMCAKNLLYLRSLLSLANTAPEEFAWIDMRESGYTAVLRGEVIYLIKCAPKLVEIREDPNCYQEIPAQWNNRSVFLSPHTRIITSIGTPIVCSLLTPQLYKIDGRWVKLGGEPYVPSSPVELTAEPHATWSYGDPASSKTLGYVSRKAIRDQ